MRRLTLLFILIAAASSGYAQVSAGGGAIVVPPIVVPPISINFDSTNSVIDQSGNVLVFDSVLTGLCCSSTSSTHVAVVSSDGKTVNGFSYSGSFQILGVAHNAVYAIVSSVTSGTVSPVVVSRKLVALRVVAGTLPATLPSIDIPVNMDVKLSAGTGAGDADTIALISGGSLAILVPAATGSAGTPHTVLLYTCDGTTFTSNPNNPITTNSQ